MNYCELYIYIEMGTEELQDLIDDNLQKCFEPGSVDAIVFQNDNYEVRSDIHSPTYPVDRSKYYVEIGLASDSDSEKLTFESAIVQLISWLRQECEYVVASCEFEDYIVAQTGWNWTIENPLPPR